ncbi:MAG TPA: sugar transferase [Desulfotomaculum sp.]|nr:MAG: Exopolysaccharide biosynthesis polyprenyl glycosylphosphotransferase [Desulfotomaculum sp. 46_80]HAG11945.1 sugar transferase [Desulfotomaculum sp.]HBY04727.1 sugar transferase [Desulfotomaculum sp.]
MNMFKMRILKPFLPYLLAAGDLLLVFLGYFLAFAIRFPVEVPVFNWQPFISVFPWIGTATLVLFGGLGLYRGRRNGPLSTIGGVVTGIAGVMIITMALTFWFRGFAFPRSVLILAMFIQAQLICVWRYFFWYFERWLYGRQELLVIGRGLEVPGMLEKLVCPPGSWFGIQQVISPEDIDQLPVLLKKANAVLLSPLLSRELKAKVLTACLEARREAFLVPDLYDIMLSRGSMLQLNDLPVVEVRDIRLSILQKAAKRGTDLFFALLCFIITAPVLVACVVIVAVSSPGPVFYIQERIGLKGKPFLLYKFRTMVHDAEKHTGPVLSAEKDPRITRAGKFLRSTRLDELPQLFNVIKGDMSIVGPRPERSFFVEQFVSELPDYHYRYLVKPGLTGMAQVFGKYTTSAEDKLRFDLYYIRHYSPLLDLKIILQTIPVAIGGETANGLNGKSNEKISHQAP